MWLESSGCLLKVARRVSAKLHRVVCIHSPASMSPPELIPIQAALHGVITAGSLSEYSLKTVPEPYDHANAEGIKSCQPEVDAVRVLPTSCYQFDMQ